MSRPRKVNTRLKQLAECRARATATTERLDESLKSLQPHIDAARAALLRLEEIKFNIEHRLNIYHNEIRATDKLIREEFPQVEPSEILSTYGFRSEYGRRGTLLDTVREVIKAAGNEGLTQKEIGIRVTEKLKLVHHTQQDFRRWTKNSLGSAMDKLYYRKHEIKRITIPGKHPKWTLSNKTPSWDDLANLDHEVSE